MNPTSGGEDMLKVVDIVPSRELDVSLDVYVPLSLTDSSFDGVPLYLRTGDLQRSLLEVALDPEHGTFVGFTAVTLPTLEETTEPLEVVPTEQVGVPQFDTADWRDATRVHGHRFIDEPAELRVRLGPDYLLIQWDKNSKVERAYTCGRTVFLITCADELSGVVLEEVSKEERATLLRAIE